MKNILLAALTFASFFATAAGLAIKPYVVNATCNGTNTGAIELYVSDAALPLSYTWDNGLDNNAYQSHLKAGIYNVTVTDNNGNSATSAIQVKQPAPMAVDLVVTNATSANMNDGSINIIIKGGTPGYTYLWNNQNTDQNLWDISAGSYRVTITDAAGCTTTASNTVHEIIQMNNNNIVAALQPGNSDNRDEKLNSGNSNDNQVSVYPIPATDHITVKSNNQSTAEISLVNISGQVVYKQESNSGNTNLEVSSLPAGNYVMVIQNDLGQTSQLVSIAK